MRPETRARVERAMRDLLYLPPRREPATGLIGVLVPELANPIFPALAEAIQARAAPEGFASILCSTTSAAYREIDYVHMLLDRRVDGMIFISSELANLHGERSHYAKLVEEGARIVFVNGALATHDIPAVGVDEHAAGELATQHLIQLGHERIGFVAGPEHYAPTRFKGAGRISALRAAGLDGHDLVAHATFSVDGGRRALRELLARSVRPTAVICSSDMMAMGVLQEAERHGLARPGGPLRRRLRRDRGGDVDRAAAHHGRAADRADRADRGRRSPVADRRARQGAPELPLPAAALRPVVDGRALVTDGRLLVGTSAARGLRLRPQAVGQRVVETRRARGASAQFPPTVPGRFMRPSTPSPSTSWAGTIASSAREQSPSRISDQCGSRAVEAGAAPLGRGEPAPPLDRGLGVVRRV